MTENAVKQAFHRLRQRYRQFLREEVAHTVATPAEIEDELRHLIAALRCKNELHEFALIFRGGVIGRNLSVSS